MGSPLAPDGPLWLVRPVRPKFPVPFWESLLYFPFHWKKIRLQQNFLLVVCWQNVGKSELCDHVQSSADSVSNSLVRSAFQMSDQPRTFKYPHSRFKTCPFICNAEKLLGPKQSIKITDHYLYLYLSRCHLLYTCTCKLHSLQKVIHRQNGETTRQPIPRTPSRHRERWEKCI